MKNIRRLCVFAGLLGLAACEPEIQNPEQTLWPASDAVELIAFTHAQEKPLTDNNVSVGEDGNITLVRDQNRLMMSWRDSGWGGVYFDTQTPFDLSSLRTGYLQLSMTIEQIDQAGIEITLLGNQGIERRLPIENQLQQISKDESVDIALSVSCLLREGDDVKNVTRPLRLTLGGSGQMILERAAFVSAPASTAHMLACPEWETLTTTPAMLDAHWAKSWWLPRHQQKLQEAAERNPEIVFLGDSITQGWENAGAEVFSEYFDRWRTLNLGFGGDRTENVLWRLQHGAVDAINPELVVLMIGTNNTGHRQDEPARVAEGVEKILQELQARLPETKVLLLAIFPRSATADDLLRRNNTLINARLRNFADGERVIFQDLNSIFLDRHGNLPEEIMPDLLHPNTHGYSLLAQKLAPLVGALISTP